MRKQPTIPLGTSTFPKVLHMPSGHEHCLMNLPQKNCRDSHAEHAVHAVQQFRMPLCGARRKSLAWACTRWRLTAVCTHVDAARAGAAAELSCRWSSAPQCHVPASSARRLSVQCSRDPCPRLPPRLCQAPLHPTLHVACCVLRQDFESQRDRCRQCALRN